MNTAPVNRTISATSMGRRTGRLASRIILWLFLGSIVIFTIFPVLITFFGSFKTNAELTAGATILPKEWHFSNYIEAWKQADFAKFTWNSLFLSTFATIGSLLVASMAAYVVDRRDFIGKRVFIAIQASTMFISIGAVVLRPQFELMVKLQLNMSLWGMILILISAHATTFFILIGFFKGIPRDLDEAALLDGCNFFSVYWRIVLPLLKPGLGVSALFAFRNAWNEYILPLVFTMSNPKLQTLTVGLANLRYGNTAATQTHLIMAGACLSILPILIVYIFANKSFMQSTAGSVKG
ncbi:carbohydrate ABC transporter permease [Paenibacillus sp. J2TS4]|uniref:carbohydrate ABC transporter permease n=1 Tax=Paenibacillus sp. J2TS4 TaxID=2807194 RepID=UPI001B195D28|nr:carbohydrate ABC transporter permease [Paenibacillus sp. J2TS4]GIP33036.1 sugar ABC transporter permease [Paenibacillus sp. J2TS4]